MISLKGLFASSKWYTKVALLMGIPVFLMLFSAAICAIINHVAGIDTAQADSQHLLWMQAFQSGCTFILGGWLYAYLTSAQPAQYFGINRLNSGWLYVIATLAMYLLSPLVSITAYWNNGIQLPESLQAIEELMRSMEDSANDLTLQIMQGNSVWILLVVMALLPAIGEEFLFRGGLQKGIQNKTGNAHLAVWVTAFVFSFIHFQFYGFIPRFVLGIALGYFYVYGKSLWIPIWAHFVNNSTAVLSYKLMYQATNETNLSTMGTPTYLEDYLTAIVALISVVLYVGSMLIFVFVARNRKAQ